MNARQYYLLHLPFPSAAYGTEWCAVLQGPIDPELAPSIVAASDNIDSIMAARRLLSGRCEVELGRAQ